MASIMTPLSRSDEPSTTLPDPDRGHFATVRNADGISVGQGGFQVIGFDISDTCNVLARSGPGDYAVAKA
jgi:hypothetical protein